VRCVSELLQADILVIATPMWNFSVPSALKAWVDHVVRAGLTFEMSAEGPRGLLRNKKAIIVTSAGGLCAQGPLEGWDACGGYLKNLLHFLGVSEVEWIRSEGRAIPGAERVIRAVV
jgi:FMN-dependent NADH-azoreductase